MYIGWSQIAIYNIHFTIKHDVNTENVGNILTDLFNNTQVSLLKGNFVYFIYFGFTFKKAK